MECFFFERWKPQYTVYDWKNVFFILRLKSRWGHCSVKRFYLTNVSSDLAPTRHICLQRFHHSPLEFSSLRNIGKLNCNRLKEFKIATDDWIIWNVFFRIVKSATRLSFFVFEYDKKKLFFHFSTGKPSGFVQLKASISKIFI